MKYYCEGTEAFPTILLFTLVALPVLPCDLAWSQDDLLTIDFLLFDGESTENAHTLFDEVLSGMLKDFKII